MRHTSRRTHGLFNILTGILFYEGSSSSVISVCRKDPKLHSSRYIKICYNEIALDIDDLEYITCYHLLTGVKLSSYYRLRKRTPNIAPVLIAGNIYDTLTISSDGKEVDHET